MGVPEDLLDKGFQLAYFIIPSRQIAISVLTGALNKLKAQHGRENRRVYWRDKYLKRGITRIAREEGDALQWLILFESDRYEREQERSGSPGPATMAIRYVKSLVRMTTAMSSFYVNIGLHRLLHNYSTAEAQLAYEAITERYLGADEYRRAKAVLMDKLERRFGLFLKICRTQHGELRFEVWDNQQQWADLVGSCLTLFIPWSTSKNCPASRDSSASGGQHLPLPSQDQADPDQLEIKRCHTFIDPLCYARLAQALAIDPPDKKLALPRFFMENSKPETRSEPPPPERLTTEERKAINDRLSAETNRRRKASAGVLKMIVDGVECFRLDRAQTNHGSFEIQEGAELIEVRGEHENEEVILATHRLCHTPEVGIEASGATIFLPGGQRLELRISPTTPAPDTPRRAAVSLDLRTNPVAAWLSKPVWRPVLKYAFTGVVCFVLGGVLGTRIMDTGSGSPNTTMGFSTGGSATVVSTPAQTTAVVHPPQAVASYRLTPDDLIVRGAGGTEVSSVVVPSRPALVELQLPVAPEDLHKTFRADLKPFMKDREVLRENLLRAKATASGGIVRFWVPTAVLESDQDYAVDLRSWSASGRLEEENTYTFRAVAK